MLTAQGLTVLRQAATLAHAVPAVRLRLREGDRVVADVRRPPFPPGSVTYLPVCGFRHAVAQAWAWQRAGRALRFRLLDAASDPAVDVGLPAGDRALPGGIYRIREGEEWWHILPVPLGLDACVEACQDDEAGPGLDLQPVLGGRVGVGFHGDEATGVTLLHARCPAGDEEHSGALVDLLQALLARCATAELLASLGVPPSPQAAP